MNRDQRKRRLETRLTRQLARTSIRHGVLSPNDKLLIAMSGGKDSYGLVHLLLRLLPRLPFRLDLVACHVAMGLPGEDASLLAEWARLAGVPFELIEGNFFETVRKNIGNGGNPCPICSRLRRGVLYTAARRLGCNKVALGHHMEDAIATLLLNLFFSGRIQAMPARYRTDEGDLEVVRPMIEVCRADLEELAKLAFFPVLPPPPCGISPDNRRLLVDKLLLDLEDRHPGLKRSMLGALKNVHPSHLLDTGLTSSRISKKK